MTQIGRCKIYLVNTITNYYYDTLINKFGIIMSVARMRHYTKIHGY